MPFREGFRAKGNSNRKRVPRRTASRRIGKAPFVTSPLDCLGGVTPMKRVALLGMGIGLLASGGLCPTPGAAQQAPPPLEQPAADAPAPAAAAPEVNIAPPADLAGDR